jgi:hypothetical protein
MFDNDLEFALGRSWRVTLPRNETRMRASRINFPSWTAMLAVLGLLVLPDHALAQAGGCDPDVERNSRGGVLGYQSRGDHCEGLYATDVAATTLWVASLTEVFQDYDLTNTAPLELRWTAPERASVHLRAHGIRRDLYYRMDAERNGGSGEWSWSTDFLAAQEIHRDDIGVLGWTSREVGGEPYEILLPLRLTQGGAAATEPSGGGYELVIVPNVRLEEVYLTLAKVASAGAHPESSYLAEREALGQRVYPTQRPIRIALPGMTEPGYYFVRVSATRGSGGPVTMDPLWIYVG